MFRNYLKTAWRNLTRNRLITALDIAGLSLGVTVCLLIAIWVNLELSFDNFHPHKNQIFRLSNTFKSESESFSQAPSGPAFGAQLPRLLPSISSACRFFDEPRRLKAGNNQFVENKGAMVDSNFFTFFGFKLRLGDPRRVLQSPNQIVLTEKLALKYFGNRDPIGQTMILDGEDALVVSGIAEDPPVNSQLQFDFVQPASYIVNKAMNQSHFDINQMWSGGWPLTFVQLENPGDVKKIEKQINEIAVKHAAQEWKENKMFYTYFLQPLTSIHLNSNLRYDSENNGSLQRVKVFTLVGLVVLLIACVNYINLTTAGAVRRAKETSVRKLVGAPRFQLVRQFFLETFIISLTAVTLGLILLKLVLPYFSQWLGTDYRFEINLSHIVLLLSFVIVISLIAGIYPAAVLSSFNPVYSLKGSFLHTRKGNLIRKSLVVFQFAITIALIASMLIIRQQMNFIRNKSLGFEGNAVVEVKFGGDSSVQNHYGAIRNELLASPYILNVSRHSQNVVGGLGNGWTTTETLDGKEISTSLYQMGADTSYFNVYGMQLAAGRFFSKDIPTDSTKAVLVNQAAVRTFGWKIPGNAIGKRFGKGKETRYVIGVVKDFNFENLHKPVEALLIFYRPQGSRLSIKIDSRHTEAALSHLRKVWKASAPDVPLRYDFVDDSIAEQYGNEQKTQTIFYCFAGLSLFIACMGLFGLSIFVVERKVKEIGIRKVLGASVQSIVQLLSSDFIRLVVISFVIACPLAWYFMSRWLDDFAYRITMGWQQFLLAGLLALFIALVTISFQSIRAAMASPVRNLRTE
ncbi:MAG: ABC transporter permease [Flavisolibacter sp.]